MTDDLYGILSVLTYVPLYLTAFVGIGIVLRLRRTHPRACWYAVAAGAVLFLNWAVTGVMHQSAVSNWVSRSGFDYRFIYLAFNAVLSALQTTSAALLIAALVTGRRQGP